MKRGGTPLQLHYDQALDYWINAVPNRPRYVVLCNFNAFPDDRSARQLGELYGVR
jgi:hypothetical protein